LWLTADVWIAKSRRYTKDILQCPLIEHFRPIDTESDIMDSHVRMMWQKKIFRWGGQGAAYIGPIKNLKENNKK
jgi:hypothetical protein